MIYDDFIASKRKRAGQIGRDCDPSECHPMLHDWQAEAVAWAVRTGRAAIFWDCGLGKTFAQLEWARLSADTALIIAPLSVARQTVREARKIGLDVRLARHGDDVTGPGLWITNYEMVHHFDMTVPTRVSQSFIVFSVNISTVSKEKENILYFRGLLSVTEIYQLLIDIPEIKVYEELFWIIVRR